MTAMDIELGVVIGRFQLFHGGQLHLLRTALSRAKRCVVVVGSAHQARSPKNPFTWQERVEMMKLALSPDELARTTFIPLRDCYDAAAWAANVRAAVDATGVCAPVALFGHRKDATSDYLHDFPDWRLVDVGLQGDVHASALRAALFATDDPAAGLAAISAQLPHGVADFLRAWMALPFFATLAQEWRIVEAERRKWAGSPYPPVFVTADAIVHHGDHVLLVRRGRAPGKGLLALPGGFLEPRETVYQTAVRELEEETGFTLFATDMRAALKGVRVFDHPERSFRGRVVTHAHYFHFAGSGLRPEVSGRDDAAAAQWVAVAELAPLEEEFHEDHFHILQAFLQQG